MAQDLHSHETKIVNDIPKFGYGTRNPASADTLPPDFEPVTMVIMW